MSDVVTWLSAVGSIGQVAVAGIAVYLAFGANRISRSAAHSNRKTQGLFDLVDMARGVGVAYRRLFEPFSDATSKTAARTEWLTMREELSVNVEHFEKMFTGTREIRDAWLRVEDEEDSHATTESFQTLSRKSVRNALSRYHDREDAFVKCRSCRSQKNGQRLERVSVRH